MDSQIARRTAISLVAAALTLTWIPGAQAYSPAPGWVATDYATGFPHFSGNQVGPTGVVFDDQGNLLVTDPAGGAQRGALYKIPPGGGDAASHLVHDGYGVATGLAF